MADKELSDQITKAVDAGRGYLISCIKKEEMFDKWYGTSVPPPVAHSTSPMLCFFTALALKESGGVCDAVRTKLLAMLSGAKKGESYGYDDKAPIDADDTAFALRTQIVLGEAVDAEMMEKALSPFRCGDSWFTFPAKKNIDNDPVFHYTYRGPSSISGPHPEVHLNILSLFQESGSDVLRIPSLPQKHGLPVSYFYESFFYGAWLLSTLCRKMGLEYLALKRAVLNKQRDGIWPGLQNGFTSVQETSLALLTLFNFEKTEGFGSKSIEYIVGQQKKNGSFKGGRLWNHRLPTGKDESWWYALDINSVVSTSLAILVLKRIISINEGTG